MEHHQLLQLIEAHERAERQLQDSCLAVWAALMTAEPELAAEILQLFGNEDAAARRASASFRELGSSPARQAAEGRAATIMSTVHKTNHGFVG